MTLRTSLRTASSILGMATLWAGPAFLPALDAAPFHLTSFRHGDIRSLGGGRHGSQHFRQDGKIFPLQALVHQNIRRALFKQGINLAEQILAGLAHGSLPFKRPGRQGRGYPGYSPVP